MGTVTAYNMANIQSALGGSNPISLSEYYRGGAYVPATRSGGTVREPTSGGYYSADYYWITSPGSYTDCIGIRWAATAISSGGSFTSYTSGIYTYYIGTFQVSGKFSDEYQVYRTYPTTININTGVPSSGSISIGQLYGAQNP